MGGNAGLAVAHPAVLKIDCSLRYGKPLIHPSRRAREYLPFIFMGSLFASLPWLSTWTSQLMGALSWVQVPLASGCTQIRSLRAVHKLPCCWPPSHSGQKTLCAMCTLSSPVSLRGHCMQWKTTYTLRIVSARAALDSCYNPPGAPSGIPVGLMLARYFALSSHPCPEQKCISRFGLPELQDILAVAGAMACSVGQWLHNLFWISFVMMQRQPLAIALCGCCAMATVTVPQGAVLGLFCLGLGSWRDIQSYYMRSIQGLACTAVNGNDTDDNCGICLEPLGTPRPIA